MALQEFLSPWPCIRLIWVYSSMRSVLPHHNEIEDTLRFAAAVVLSETMFEYIVAPVWISVGNIAE